MLIDLHTHTAPKSRDSGLRPDELIRHAKAVGLDGVCFTDHDSFWSVEAVRLLAEEHEFLVLRGAEVTTDFGHVLVFGLEEYIFGLWQVETLRQIVDAVGGALVLAHPFREESRRYSLAGSPDASTLFDAAEVYNGTESLQANRGAAELVRSLGLKGTAGSDSHIPADVGVRATRFDDRVRTEAELIAALKHGRYRPAAVKGPPLR